MGKQSIFEEIREWIGGLGFMVFLWSIRMTCDEYISEIEKMYETRKGLQ